MATVTNLLASSRLADGYDLTVLHNGKATTQGRSLAAGIAAQGRLTGRIALALSQPGPRVTHIHTCSGFTFFRDCYHAAIARVLGSKVVWHIHGGRFEDFLGSLSPVKRKLASHFLETASAVIVLSRQWIHRLHRFGPRANWQAIENGVSVPGIAVPVEENQPLLFLGHLGRAKGTADLVEALILAHRQCPSVLGRLAGNETQAGQKQALSGRIAQAGARKAVEFLGVVKGSAKDRALAEAGFFCLPSYAEGLPMAMLEAMAAGLPVIVTQVGAIPEVITDGVEGFLIKPGDVEALADRIIRLTQDAALRKQMGQAARSKVIAEYSLDKMAERISRVYRQALGER
jgi:glycosyltransferase involved in cell wall biosynthesis